MSRPARDFRKPMAVTQLHWFRNDGTYPVCPQCGVSLEREYQRFCDRSGQRLGWEGYENAQIIDMDHHAGQGGPRLRAGRTLFLQQRAKNVPRVVPQTVPKLPPNTAMCNQQERQSEDRKKP